MRERDLIEGEESGDGARQRPAREQHRDPHGPEARTQAVIGFAVGVAEGAVEGQARAGEVEGVGDGAAVGERREEDLRQRGRDGRGGRIEVEAVAGGGRRWQAVAEECKRQWSRGSRSIVLASS